MRCKRAVHLQAKYFNKKKKKLGKLQILNNTIKPSGKEFPWLLVLAGHGVERIFPMDSNRPWFLMRCVGDDGIQIFWRAMRLSIFPRLCISRYTVVNLSSGCRRFPWHPLRHLRYNPVILDLSPACSLRGCFMTLCYKSSAIHRLSFYYRCFLQACEQ